MIKSKYKSNTKFGDIGKISLNDDEWISFINGIIASKPMNADTKKLTSLSEIEMIDANFCLPLTSNTGFIKQQFELEESMVSVTCEGKGDVYLRFWLAENGISSELIDTMKEVFPSLLADEVLQDFWMWWDTLPLEPQNVGGMLITKQYKEFGIGHLQAWLKQIIGQKEPKKAWDRYIFNLKPWMHAYELYLLWISDKLINDNGGKISLAKS